MRLSDTPDADQKVTAGVQSSKSGDCASGQKVAIAVQDLQEMHDDFRRQLDHGLRLLASDAGKGGLPQAPDTSTVSREVPAPDPTAASQIQDLEQQANLTEQALKQPANQTGQADQAAQAEPAEPAQPASVQLGQTPEQVQAALGQPDKMVDIGSKKIWIYKDLKITFLNGKVSDVQ